MEENKSTTVKTALFNRGGKVKSFAILTAENPMGIQVSAQENNERTRKLKELLKNLHLQYVRIVGKYNTKEHSVMIINLTLSDSIYIATKFSQESFFYGDSTGICYYETSAVEYKNSGTIDYKLIEKTNKVDTVQDADDFFSRYGDFKFSIYLKYFNESITEDFDEDELEMSLQDNRTFRSRVIHRVRACNKACNK